LTQGGFGADPFGGAPFGDPFGGPVGQPPPGPTPPAYPPAPRQPETNTLATLSVVFAFVFAPAGAVLGHLSLSQIARTGQRGRDRALVGITLSYVVIVVAVVAFVVWAVSGPDAPSPGAPSAPTIGSAATTTSPAPSTSTPPAPPPPPAPPKVDADALPGVLLPLDEVQRVSDDPGQASIFTAEGLIEPRPELGTYSDTSCLGSYARGTPMGYAGNEPVRYVGADSGNMNAGPKAGQVVRQGAAMFADDAAAQKAFDDYVAMWRNCVGKSTQFTPTNGTGFSVVYGTPEELAPGVMAVRNTSPELNVVQLIHVIAVKSNVLIDNTFNSRALGDIPIDVTQAMLDRIPN
jgi:hypothetical protein